MSEIKVNSIKGVGASDAAITVNNTDGTCTANITNNLSNRNLIINGDMRIAQRGTSSTGISTNGYYTLDRWQIFLGGTDGRVTMSQVADVHDGFANALKLECTTADTSIAAGENFGFRTFLEGQDLQQIQKGSSAAKQLTLSFYVKGNANATYTCELTDRDNDRTNAQTFNVTTSWSRVTLTFAADTTGAFDDDNNSSLQIAWWLHAGSTYTGGTFSSNTWASRVQANRVNSSQTSFFDSTSRTLFITGVQLEVGTATDFEHRSFGQEALLCKRYYQVIKGNSDLVMFGTGRASGTTAALVATQLAVPLRASPTISSTDFKGWGTGGSATATSTTPTVQSFNDTDNQLNMQFASLSSLTNARVACVSCSSGSNLVMDSEL